MQFAEHFEIVHWSDGGEAEGIESREGLVGDTRSPKTAIYTAKVDDISSGLD